MAAGVGDGAAAGAGWGLSYPLLRGPLSCLLVVSLFRVVKQPLELFLQRLGALTPEVSLLLAVVTMVILHSVSPAILMVAT